MKHASIVIIGSGPCGLGAAWRLHENRYSDFTVFEQEDFSGGLAVSVRDACGFCWDLGGHVIHSHYKYFDKVYDLIMRGSYIKHRRSAWIYMLNRYIPYPFQYNLNFLPSKIFLECLNGIKNRSKKKYAPHYADWILKTYGAGIAKYFQIPYAKKVWAYPPEQMSTSWVGDRVAPFDRKRILQSMHIPYGDMSWGPNYLFKYPKQGGNGELWARLSKKLKNKIYYSKKVIRIDAKKNLIIFSDNTYTKYQHLLTTMPIDILLELIHEIELPKINHQLHFSTTHLVGVGIRGNTPDVLVDKLWIYYPESIFPFHRIMLLHNFSKSMTPSDSWSILAEISSSNYKHLDNKNIEEKVIQDLIKLKYVTDRSNIVSVWNRTLIRGYPTPTLERDSFLNQVISILESHSIYSRGRFGLWKYEISNQDHTFMQGVEWVNKILFNQPEITMLDPDFVNSSRNS